MIWDGEPFANPTPFLPGRDASAARLHCEVNGHTLRVGPDAAWR